MKRSNQGVLKHEGKVVEVLQEELKIEVFAQTACAGCHAKSVCGSSTGTTKIMSVRRYNDGRFSVGDHVNVIVQESMGFKAVFIAYLIPLFILMVLLLTLPLISSNELLAGLVSIGFVTLYYLILALLRKKLGAKFVFTVEKID